MKRERLRNVPGYSDFKKECGFCQCCTEYPGWTGEERYIVFTNLPCQEFEARYPAVARYISPYILVGVPVKEALDDYQRNEKKHHWRRVNAETGFDYDSEAECRHRPMKRESTEQQCLPELVFQEALGQLTPVERRRMWLYCIQGFSYREIAQLEHASVPAVFRSVERALHKMKKSLEED